MFTLVLVYAGIVLVLALIVLLLRNVLRQSNATLPDAEWLDNFNVSRYRPMQRLLAEEDYGFLAANGGSRRTIARLRAERRRVFRAYLRNMVRDFDRLHRAARVLAVHAETDRSDFAIQLVTLRLTFAWTVTTIEVRLVLHSLGLGSVDARSLIRSLDKMSAGYSSLSPAGQMAGA